MEYLNAFLIAALATLIAMPLVLKFFPKLRLMDKPGKYGLTRVPIPYSVGIVTFLIFVGVVLMFVPTSTYLVGFLFAATLIVLVSCIDDFYPLPPALRLGVQILAGVIMVMSDVGIHSISNPFGEPFSLDTYRTVIGGFEIVWLADMFTILWIVILINSVNWLDGVSGMASGVGLIAAVAIFILSTRPGFHVLDQYPVSIMSAVMVGILVVFVCFDFHPPKLLMGDSGSMFIGFTLAVLSIFSGGKVATAFLILGFPLLDFFWVILQRIAAGKSPFQGKDKLHLHDKLMQSGWGIRQVIFSVYFLSILFGFSALFLGTKGKFFAFLLLFVCMVMIILFSLHNPRKSNK